MKYWCFSKCLLKNTIHFCKIVTTFSKCMFICIWIITLSNIEYIFFYLKINKEKNQLILTILFKLLQHRKNNVFGSLIEYNWNWLKTARQQESIIILSYFNEIIHTKFTNFHEWVQRWASCKPETFWEIEQQPTKPIGSEIQQILFSSYWLATTTSFSPVNQWKSNSCWIIDILWIKKDREGVQVKKLKCNFQQLVLNQINFVTVNEGDFVCIALSVNTMLMVLNKHETKHQSKDRRIIFNWSATKQKTENKCWLCQ